MEEVSITETESRYFGDLFLCCDAENTGKVPILKATEMFRSANLSNDVIRQITSLAGIPQTAIHMSRAQFYSCLKLIAAHQAGVQPLRVELIAAAVALPLPKFSWTSSPTRPIDGRTTIEQMANGSGGTTTHRGSVGSGEPEAHCSGASSLSSSTVSASLVNSSTAATLGSSGTWRNNGAQLESQTDTANSDLPSTDSEVEPADEAAAGGSRSKDKHRHHHQNAGLNGSPEAWSTASDSPTPTNSVTERPWAQNTRWQGLFCEEQRQLLGTEEESSDRHSSDEDPAAANGANANNTTTEPGTQATQAIECTDDVDMELLYAMSADQRVYYLKQFRFVQPDLNGLVSGNAAREYFDKSLVSMAELRHIWKLCNVPRDGALNFPQFTAVMHLVVLRRNGIAVPPVLPACLNPRHLWSQKDVSETLKKISAATLIPGLEEFKPKSSEPLEADLLHLDDDDDVNAVSMISVSGEVDALDGTIVPRTNAADGGARSPVLGQPAASVAGTLRTRSQSNTPPPPPPLLSTSSASSAAASTIVEGVLLSNTSSTSLLHAGSTNASPATAQKAQPHYHHHAPHHSQPQHHKAVVPLPAGAAATTTAATTGAADWMSQSKEWTKFTESPTTSTRTSPSPEPVNFDMQRTAQAVVSDPLILHPVPVRVTPIGCIVGGAAAAAAAPGNSGGGGGDALASNDDANAAAVHEAATAGSIGSPLAAQFVSSTTAAAAAAAATATATPTANASTYRHDGMPTGEQPLRAIQRPQPKKVLLASGAAGALPPPPQRETSVGGGGVTESVLSSSSSSSSASSSSTTAANANATVTAAAEQLTGAQVAAMFAAASSSGGQQQQQQQQQHYLQAPPPPPPRPHKHARSSSLDLNKLKLNGPQPPEIPPRVSPQIVQQVSLDVGESSSFADFAHFPEDAAKPHHHAAQRSMDGGTGHQRHTINATLNNTAPLRSSAFEVYRKPPPADTSSSIPDPDSTAAASAAAAAAAAHRLITVGAAAAQATASVGEYERRVAAITDSLRQVSFKQSERNVADVVHHLREQNHLLMHLCSDLTEELATVHRKKEELRLRYEGVTGAATATAAQANGVGNATATTTTTTTQQLKQLAAHHHSIV